MERLKRFFLTSLLGGMVVILPVAILAATLVWLYNLIGKIIDPLTKVLVAQNMREIFANIVVLVILALVCFSVGVFVRTRAGAMLHQFVETHLLKIAPGYSLVKETVLTLFNNKKSPFSTVALVQLFGNDTLTTAFVVDRHESGRCTVFVPTGPNPTSGLIYHLAPHQVHVIDVPVETAMRSIISCGMGSSRLIDALHRDGARETDPV